MKCVRTARCATEISQMVPKDARICTFECTFCADCVSERLGDRCPNCGGNFAVRPTRPEGTTGRFPHGYGAEDSTRVTPLSNGGCHLTPVMPLPPDPALSGHPARDRRRLSGIQDHRYRPFRGCTRGPEARPHFGIWPAVSALSERRKLDSTGGPRAPKKNRCCGPGSGTSLKPTPRYRYRRMTTILRREEGWSDLIKLSSAGAAHPGPTHATGSGRLGAAGRYVRPRSRYARLPR